MTAIEEKRQSLEEAKRGAETTAALAAVALEMQSAQHVEIRRNQPSVAGLPAKFEVAFSFANEAAARRFLEAVQAAAK